MFTPIIELCESGIRVSKFLAQVLVIPVVEMCIRPNKELSEIFIIKDSNKLVGENDTIRYPKLAKTLRIISESNIQEFYNGELSKVIVEEITTNGILIFFKI